jgi:hypothetical protein
MKIRSLTTVQDSEWRFKSRKTHDVHILNDYPR